jgi:4-hydroxy-3-polyprenylbenzoate decarboxylase
MYANLAAFIADLRAHGELHEIHAPVDSRYEITEIADRCMKRGDQPALLFRNVCGSPFPVLINAFATPTRMARALGVASLDDLAERVRSLLHAVRLRRLSDLVGLLGHLRDLRALIPRTVSRAACQEVVLMDDEVDLRRLPVLTTWPLDGGPYITLPLVFTKDPVSGSQNVGMYRMQVYDARTTGMHWQRHKHGREHQEASPAAARIPVAVALGADPATVYAGSAPLPAGVDEMMLAGFLRGASVPMVACKTVDLKVPAEAEFVLEGYVDNGELRREGPFGDHTGVYSPPEDYPVFHVTCLTHRRNPVYWTTIVGRPPMEDVWLGKATERLFLPFLQQMIPEIVDYDFPPEGVFQNLVLVSIRKRYPGQARKVMYALWGLGHMMMLTRTIVVVDHDVNVHDYSQTAWTVFNNVDAGRDLVLAPGPVDALDHAAPLPLFGTKLGIDATRKTAEEGYTREWPVLAVMSDEVKAAVTRRWAEFGLGEWGRR